MRKLNGLSYYIVFLLNPINNMSLFLSILALPAELIREIKTFIVYDSATIEFRYGQVYCNQPYSMQYKSAFIGDKLVKITNGFYLARIHKKNGKHRYYLSKLHEERTCDCCGKERCFSYYCRESPEYDYWYESKYVGKDINRALLELVLLDKVEN